ncbi:tail assembly protein [Cronobacter turicensis]|uniref:tail assembly protein n=1 Tax=Cronobacter TaxID=413496 RepID=UPI0013EBC3D0|nr:MULTISPECIES: tail assembly protein [Cronobacter]EKY3200696.1 tail assembly protein [Cronobacter turicensis]EKY3209972.1 tail assembly protein [Cronobacter turicensis]EKY3216368.1 tail assembly protein [Cronobacter turicensis]KAF6597576.1 tail assembly protein [Cronobacter sp. EKM101R]KAF6598516.1 tail assembly protein [Cronobacter sp. EKM102R]
MTQTLTKIELGGALARQFGKTHLRAVKSTAEAVRALCCTIPGFEKFLNTSKQRGLAYHVFRGKKNLGVDELGFPVTGDVIRIVPVVIGSKRAGIGQTILGAVLVVVGAVITYFGGGAVGVPMMKMGAAVMLGGVIQMLSPQVPGLASKQDADNRASYAFGGVTNTASQGYPVPLLYGKRRIGGAVISAGIYAEDQQ